MRLWIPTNAVQTAAVNEESGMNDTITIIALLVYCVFVAVLVVRGELRIWGAAVGLTLALGVFALISFYPTTPV